ncbi:MAG: hypothetical protein ACE5NA_03395 [Nitrospiraceae bacterium]
MARQIVSFQIPTLEIALARAATPSLRGRPVAIASPHSPRALIQEVSCEAQLEGVLAGMLVDQARRRSPSLSLLPSDPVRIQQAQEALDKVVGHYAPIWEPVRAGDLFLDLTGTTRLFGLASDTALHIQREVARHYGLASVVGVGSNKLVARTAAMLVHPLQLCEVRPGSEPNFLAPLPITVLPGLSRSHARMVLATLTDLNLRTWGEIAEIPLPHLELVLGREAALLHNWGQGIDPSPVRSLPQQPRLDASLTLDPDEIDEGRLLGCLRHLLQQVCRELRIRQRVCRRLALTVRYSDQVEVARRQPVRPGTFWEVDLLPYLRTLFGRCVRRRVRLRRMTVAAEVLAPSEEQLPLFAGQPSPEETTQARARRLALALDRLQERFGDEAIWYGGCRREA